MRPLPLIISLIYLIAAVYCGQQIINNSRQYRQLTEEHARSLDFKKRMLDLDEWLGEKSNANPAEAEAFENGAKSYQRKANRFALFFVLLSAGFFAALAFAGQKAEQRKSICFSLLIVAVASLYVGIFTPMLEIAAFEEDLRIPIEFDTGIFSLNINHVAEFDGRMYFYYQSKSIWELIVLLLREGNLVVGISILAFSILFPLTKVVASILGLVRPALLEGSKLLSGLVHSIGKWSMADVFVAGVFLAFLAFNNMEAGIETESRTLPGLYFFLAYVVLSITSSFLLPKKD